MSGKEYLRLVDLEVATRKPAGWSQPTGAPARSAAIMRGPSDNAWSDAKYTIREAPWATPRGATSLCCQSRARRDRVPGRSVCRGMRAARRPCASAATASGRDRWTRCPSACGGQDGSLPRWPTRAQRTTSLLISGSPSSFGTISSSCVSVPVSSSSVVNSSSTIAVESDTSGPSMISTDSTESQKSS